MKTIFALALLGTLTLASCKKDYTCSCSVSVHQPAFDYGGMEVQPESTSSTSSSSTIKDKKDDAKTKCESANGTTSTASQWAAYGAEPTTTTTACAIK
nr:hypothetical protein [uncultured Fluviicola sp.]